MNEYLLPYSMMLDSKLKKLNGYTVYADESSNMRKARIKDSTNHTPLRGEQRFIMTGEDERKE